ncbi:hypothetical protein ES765_18970 [Maribacter sp. ACAM166]|nr:hypothetical protein ES765_18970 [Maribacter sp. ACAM166]
MNFDEGVMTKRAKNAGMKYIVVTTKYHDDFAMYDFKSNDFVIVKAISITRNTKK